MKIYAATDASVRLVDAVDIGQAPRAGATSAVIGQHLKLSTHDLATYFFAGWKPDLADLLVVAAGIEFCDFLVRRPSWGWARTFDVRVAVHSPELWERPDVLDALQDAAGHLTGDLWRFSFVKRLMPLTAPKEQMLDLGDRVDAVIPYSTGLDSRAVAALTATDSKLVRVRLGSAPEEERRYSASRIPFKAVPFKVKLPRGRRNESSARSRGFKFAAVTAIAAHLAGAKQIIVTESGQGALGPTLAVTGQSYPDYRVHPTFMVRMERLVAALYGEAATFHFPRLWSTKGQTVLAASMLVGGAHLADTRSCWQQARQVGYKEKWRQCGVCAACMLRRMSMHAASIPEDADTYLYSDEASDLATSGPNDLPPPSSAMRAYAIAGVLHLDHLAEMTLALHLPTLTRASVQTAEALGMDRDAVADRYHEVLSQHAEEWRAYRKSLPIDSFVNAIAQAPL